MDSGKLDLNKIFDIVGYSGDKQELTNKILGLCYFNAIADLIESLPEEKREEAENEILGVKDEQQAENIKKYFTDTQFTDALKGSSEKIFSGYYNSIKSSLSESQIIQLNDYLSSVVPQTA